MPCAGTGQPSLCVPCAGTGTAHKHTWKVHIHMLLGCSVLGPGTDRLRTNFLTMKLLQR